jgi:hypothetical protein
MFVTNNAIYLHFPKNGGTWMRKIIDPIVIDSNDADYPDTSIRNRVFFIVRNPWSWYVCYYNFIRYGSEISPVLDMKHTIFQTFKRIPTFEEFVTELCNGTSEFKKLFLAYVKLEKMKSNKFTVQPISLGMAESWNNSNKSFYQHSIDVFASKATDVGKMETLKEDLTKMLSSVGDLTPEVQELLNSPRVNVGPEVDYRTYYSKELEDLVRNTHSGIIERYGYSF